jgi:hypothetical protein
VILANSILLQEQRSAIMKGPPPYGASVLMQATSLHQDRTASQRSVIVKDCRTRILHGQSATAGLLCMLGAVTIFTWTMQQDKDAALTCLDGAPIICSRQRQPQQPSAANAG